jgi:hypothetical protein
LKKAKLLIPAIALVFISVWNVAVCGQPLTNEQIVLSTVKQAVAEKVTGDTSLGIQVTVKSGELERLIGDGIRDGLQDKFGQPIYLTELDPRRLTINYEILGFDFTYKKGHSRGFLKSNKIARDLRCQVRLSIDNTATGISISHEISAIYHDEIEPADLNYAKSRTIPELSPAAPGSGWSRYAEPSLVIASVGTLVYLFFANR